MTGRLIDSSTVISLLKGTLPTEWRAKIRDDLHAISILTYFEVCRYYGLAGKTRELEDVRPILMEFNILPLSRAVCEAAAAPRIAQRLASVDSLIYATAQENGLELVTRDKDFKGLPGAIVV